MKFFLSQQYENGFAKVRREGKKFFEYIDLLGNISTEKTKVGEIFYQYLNDLIHHGTTRTPINNIPYEYFSDDNFITAVVNLFVSMYVYQSLKGHRSDKTKQDKAAEIAISLAKSYCNDKILYGTDENCL